MSSIPIANSCSRLYEQVPIKCGEDDYSSDRDLLMKEGINLMTEKEVKAERKQIWKMVGKMTEAAFSGDLAKVSFPVYFNEDRTFLERIADFFSFLHKFINLSIRVDDPSIKLSFITVGIMAGFFTYFQKKKPWNPMLGETYATKWPDGTTYYAEQIAHHPPTSAFELFGAKSSFHIYGVFRPIITKGVNHVVVKQTGEMHLDVPSGEAYTWVFPNVKVHGIFTGKRWQSIKGPLIVREAKSHLKCEITIHPKKDRSKGILERSKTAVYGEVLPENSSKALSVISGDYIKELKIDGQVVWTLGEPSFRRPAAVMDPSDLIPSDARYRIDRGINIRGEIEKANRAKMKLEDVQRKEEKLRIYI